MLRITILTLIALTVAVGCTPQAARKVGENLQAQKEKLAEQNFKIGDVVEVNKRQLTVHGISDFDEPSPILQPQDASLKIIAVEVTIKNSGANTISYNPFHFKVKDSENYTYQYALQSKTPKLAGGKLQPGDEVRGFITFRVPQDVDSLDLIYTPNPAQKFQAIVDLD